MVLGIGDWGLGIGLFSFLHSEIATCPPLKGVCCTNSKSANSCKCVDSRLPECKYFVESCGNKYQKLIYTKTETTLQTKCVNL